MAGAAAQGYEVLSRPIGCCSGRGGSPRPSSSASCGPNAIRAAQSSTRGLLAVEREDVGDVLGYCGLVEGGREPDGPDLAYELLRRAWGQG